MIFALFIALIATIIVTAVLAVEGLGRLSRRQFERTAHERDLNPAPRLHRRLLGSPAEVAKKDIRWRKAAAKRKLLDRRADWNLPRIETPNELGQWFGLKRFGEMVLLANPQGKLRPPRGGDARRLENYSVRTIPKRSGGTRVICAPKPRLKAVQRRIHAEILAKVPLHPAAAGFRRGGSTLAHAEPHVGRDVVLAWDLQDFFPSISKPRVGAFFRWLGYPASVSHVLALLCTTTLPNNWPPNAMRTIPQGAPTSPAISNAVCFRLDCRLAGLAKKFGASYSRYADDLAFSGDFEFKRGLSRFVPLARAILREEGFRVKAAKTRFMRSGKRQFLTGLNVNHRPSLGRAEYDVLKAILTNAERAGSLESQNRDKREHFADHVRGRVAWYRRFHPGRGDKLLARLNALEGRADGGHPGPASPAAPPPE